MNKTTTGPRFQLGGKPSETVTVLPTSSYGDPDEFAYRNQKVLGNDETVVFRPLSMAEENLRVAPTVRVSGKYKNREGKVLNKKFGEVFYPTSGAEKIQDDGGDFLSEIKRNDAYDRVVFMLVYIIEIIDSKRNIKQEIGKVMYMKVNNALMKQINALMNGDTDADDEFDEAPDYDFGLKAALKDDNSGNRAYTLRAYRKYGKDRPNPRDGKTFEELFSTKEIRAILEDAGDLLDHIDELIAEQRSPKFVKSQFLRYSDPDAFAGQDDDADAGEKRAPKGREDREERRPARGGPISARTGKSGPGRYEDPDPETEPADPEDPDEDPDEDPPTPPARGGRRAPEPEPEPDPDDPDEEPERPARTSRDVARGALSARRR